MFNEYPYTDNNIMNLDYILSEVAKMKKAQGEFMATNSIKYGGVWDITKTYEKWTIVESGGLAYINADIVPPGIAIDNTDYWELVFDGSSLIGTMTYDHNGSGRPDESTMSLTSDGVFSPKAATSDNLGIVKPSNNMTVTDGIIDVKTATNSTAGIITPGNTMNIVGGVIDVNTATANTEGIVQPGNTMSINNGVIDVNTATASTEGIVQPGNTMSINNGIIDVNTATASTEGIVQPGNTMSINNGVIDVNTATSSSLGIVQPDNTSIVVNSSGTISAVSTLPVTVPTMTSSVNGIGRPDNTTITVDNDGVMTAALPPTMTSSVNGIGRPDNTTITVDSNGVMTGAKYSNPNLLDNAWFTVNQKAITTGSFSNEKIFDRWRTAYGGSPAGNYASWSLSDGILTFDARNTNYVPYFSNYTGTPLEVGEQYTISIMYEDNTVNSYTFVAQSTGNEIGNYVNGVAPAWFYGSNFFMIRGSENAYARIKAVKLEKGSVCTLQLDSTPNYADELLKCQRYFIRINGTNAGTIISNGYVLNTTDSNILLRLPVPMTSTPTISSAGTFALKGGSISDISSISLESASDNQSITFNCTGTGLVSNTNVVLYSKVAGSYIDLSAEL